MKIRIGGVPEHFNLPWHLAIENKHFEKEGLDVEWITYPGGTGAMTKGLRNDEADICILLTEGIIADIVKGNPSKIVGMYVNTPLIWGIHTGVSSNLSKYGEIFDAQYAISRYGSGSHLIPVVDAYMNKKQIEEEQFTVIKNIDGALDSLTKNDTDVFYWEKFTTKPYVDFGKLKRIGEFVTPWSCFAIAASDKMVEERTEELKKVMQIIYFNCEQFMHTLNAIDLVSKRYKQQPQDVEQWFYCTEWATNDFVSTKMIKNVQYMLKKAGVIDEMLDTEKILKRL